MDDRTIAIRSWFVKWCNCIRIDKLTPKLSKSAVVLTITSEEYLANSAHDVTYSTLTYVLEDQKARLGFPLYDVITLADTPKNKFRRKGPFEITVGHKFLDRSDGTTTSAIQFTATTI
jgi:hypothetical protein